MVRVHNFHLGTVAAILITVAAGIAFAAWFNGSSQPQACTEEAKMCPDGSAVGRTGPNCQFAPCPSPSPTARRTVSLSFYNPALDKDAAGNVLCSSKGLVTVKREAAFNNTPIQEAIRTLLTATPTSAETGQGVVSEFPLAGVKLVAASLTNGTLTLTFEDPDHRTGGGSCFVGILRAQVEGTAKQFPEVREVRLMPEDLFQP